MTMTESQQADAERRNAQQLTMWSSWGYCGECLVQTDLVVNRTKDGRTRVTCANGHLLVEANYNGNSLRKG